MRRYLPLLIAGVIVLIIGALYYAHAFTIVLDRITVESYYIGLVDGEWTASVNYTLTDNAGGDNRLPGKIDYVLSGADKSKLAEVFEPKIQELKQTLEVPWGEPWAGILQFDPTSLDFDAGTTVQTFDVENTSAGSVAVTISTSNVKLTVSPASGSLNAGQTVTVTVTADKSGVAPGTYTQYVDIESQYSSRRIRCTIVVPEPPE